MNLASEGKGKKERERETERGTEEEEDGTRCSFTRAMPLALLARNNGECDCISNDRYEPAETFSSLQAANISFRALFAQVGPAKKSET